jgi:hypothetical protein
VIALQTFKKTHGNKPLDAFLRTVKTPYVYIESLKTKSPQGFQTVANANFKSMLQEDDEGQLLAVEKRAGSNAFGMMITMGRAPNNDLVIPDQRVSKFHAYFRQDGSDWSIVDANSRNGTSVDGAKLAPQAAVPVASGAEILLSDDLQLFFLQPPQLHSLLANGYW